MILVRIAAAPAFLAPAILALALAGCGSSAPKISTASVLGSDGASQAQPLPEKPVTPEQRAAQVGATSARAEKCGYVFDPAKLRATYIASEIQGGAAPDQMVKVEKSYDTIKDAVSKAIAGDASYCNANKTKQIKADLTRHLAGDYSPPAETKVAEKAGFFENKCESCNNKPLTADSFWDKNGEQRRSRP